MGQLFGELNPQGPLLQVREGMTVYDHSEKHVGTVKEIYFGDGSEQARDAGTAPATADYEPERPASILEGLGEALHTRNNLPDTARDHLLRVGYLTIAAVGLFAGTRYATAEQIATVDGDSVTLNIGDDELIRN